MDIKLVLTDIDGVWTDGGMYYDETGNEWKKFNTSDSAGVLLLREAGIETGIITGEDNEMVKRRANKLKISIVKTGVRRKVDALNEICKLTQIDAKNIAYIGDDIIDIPVFQQVGFSATPANAPDYVKKHASVQLTKKGGDGVFREFAETILSNMNLLEASLEAILQKLR